jgi:hyaluronoglucosaminidase
MGRTLSPVPVFLNHGYNIYMKNRPKIGVVEGFFGPAWPKADRLSYAPFIAQTGGGFYIYAPKQDPHLRKKWREAWSEEYLASLRSKAEHFKSHGVTFGVGLSPFGLGKTLSDVDRGLLHTKLRQLQDAGVELLGLFFDDMPSDEDLAATQIRCVEEVRKHFLGELVFCPSYYTYDPILDKVFGQRPAHYLEDIAKGVPLDVELAWTGPKVISPTIDVAHMREVRTLLKRAPYIWENIFANDGPKNCKFLKLKPFSGREEGVAKLASAFAFNMMNQPQLSKILFLASRLVIEQGLSADEGFERALDQHCSPAFAIFLRGYREVFLEKGLEHLEVSRYLPSLGLCSDPGAREIEAWLRGEYVVGAECLTD